MRIQEVVDKNLCLGCGICTYDPNIESMDYSFKKGLNIPKLDPKKDYELASKLCPAKGYSIFSDAEELYSSGKYSLELGFVDKLYVGHSYSPKVLKNATSGGIMTQILIYILENKIVDKVAVTKFIYTDQGPRTKTFLTNIVDEILESQGSKYCPVDISSFLDECKNFDGKIAYVGTPCQIAGLRQIQKIDPILKQKLTLTIANFCGGFKNHNNIRKLAERHSVDYKKISFFRFRGGGQPGSLLMKDSNNDFFEMPYPNYVGYTGYSKMLRCHLCVDATGELADIACGDAWLDKYITDNKTWSIILTRSDFATKIIEKMKSSNYIYLEFISPEDVFKSQSLNITSKKYRQFSKYKLYHILGYKLPLFDGGFNQIPTSIKTEVIIFLNHKIKYYIEIFGLYKFIRNLKK
jgi:coenzyme F420 hydrogenase subunit beta